MNQKIFPKKFVSSLSKKRFGSVRFWPLSRICFPTMSKTARCVMNSGHGADWYLPPNEKSFLCDTIYIRENKSYFPLPRPSPYAQLPRGLRAVTWHILSIFIDFFLIAKAQSGVLRTIICQNKEAWERGGIHKTSITRATQRSMISDLGQRAVKLTRESFVKTGHHNLIKTILHRNPPSIPAIRRRLVTTLKSNMFSPL